jgi:predicted RNA binding protein YcfA (HicA-like mRNA interferase family)
MRKIPVNLYGRDLVQRLKRLGYEKVRQEGSHITLTTLQGGEHHAYVPDHKPIKVTTLRRILKDVAAHFGLSLSELMKQLDL